MLWQLKFPQVQEKLTAVRKEEPAEEKAEKPIETIEKMVSAEEKRLVPSDSKGTGVGERQVRLKSR